MSQIYFYWNQEYADKILRHNSSVPALNIIGKCFQPSEVRSLRKMEVVLLPSTQAEYESMRAFGKATFNPYGVVHITKYPPATPPTTNPTPQIEE